MLFITYLSILSILNSYYGSAFIINSNNHEFENMHRTHLHMNVPNNANTNDSIRDMVDTKTATNRRDFGTSILLNAISTIFIPEYAMASENNKNNPGLLSVDEVAKRLHVIPTFTIVDPSGVPYAVFGEDAKLTAYFFLTYPEANRILKLAKDSSKDTWKDARISTVPLDFAMTLETKSTKGSYFVVSSADEDLDDAISIESKFENLDEGRNIPLFYFANFKKDNDSKFPMYFRKSELEKAWKDTHPELPYPKVRLTEFVSVLTDMLSPKSKKTNSGLGIKELQMVSFECPLDSLEYAKKCDIVGKGKESFKIGERIVVL